MVAPEFDYAFGRRPSPAQISASGRACQMNSGRSAPPTQQVTGRGSGSRAGLSAMASDRRIRSVPFIAVRSSGRRSVRGEIGRQAVIRIDRKLNSTAVIDVLTDLFILRGVPGHVRSDNVLCWDEFATQGVRSRGIRATGCPEDACPRGPRR